MPVGLVQTWGCAARDHASERLLDLTDVVDLRVGAGIGAGAKVEVTDYLGTGVGLGGFEATFEFYGRSAVSDSGTMFLHAVVIGSDGVPFCCPRSNDASTYVLGIRTRREGVDLPVIDRFRVGGEAWIIAEIGLYLNLGEIYDFAAGLVGLDPANDDDLPKGHPPGRDSRIAAPTAADFARATGTPAIALEPRTARGFFHGALDAPGLWIALPFTPATVVHRGGPGAARLSFTAPESSACVDDIRDGRYRSHTWAEPETRASPAADTR